jgi:hypothetical protein
MHWVCDGVSLHSLPLLACTRSQGHPGKQGILHFSWRGGVRQGGLLEEHQHQLLHGEQAALAWLPNLAAWLRSVPVCHSVHCMTVNVLLLLYDHCARRKQLL